MSRATMLRICTFLAFWTFGGYIAADDGYQLWLSHKPLQETDRDQLAVSVSQITRASDFGKRPTAQLAIRELSAGLSSLTGSTISVGHALEAKAVILATPAGFSEFGISEELVESVGEEGFLIKATVVHDKPVTLVAARQDIGLLYGVFELLRQVQAGANLANIDLRENPAIQLRLLNHWDNLDRYVERGYAGQSIWDWWHLPDRANPRYTDYARANASIGINGVALNNVNASPQILTEQYIDKAAALADIFRPWGLRVYLSVRFSSPMDIGGLQTADPLSKDVRDWWREKASQIYERIPDFGGFLVKANSEGQPGPQDYGRSHAEGANMLAQALAPHGGVVMWRAFVYSQHQPEDRVKQAYNEFKPLDGQFEDNVLVQVKNGPLDFQPREPFHPLFGGMKATPLMMELQVTQEYLGFATHLAYLGAMWEEVLSSDTFATGRGDTVSRIVSGSVYDQQITGLAGVANIGTDRNWSGSIFGQANWYALGRLAWDPALSARDVAREWLGMTFSQNKQFLEITLGMMMNSHDAVVNYMTPLGLTHIMGTGHHYGPAPWINDLHRPEWNPYYYHRADRDGIGFDRTPGGSNAVAQYARPLSDRFSQPETTPDSLKLWFHRMAWDQRLNSGETLWEGLVTKYDEGVRIAESMQDDWEKVRDHVDTQRFESVRENLQIQVREARWWRDACLAYFAEVSGLELPEGTRPPEHSLQYYQSLEFPFAPGN